MEPVQGDVCLRTTDARLNTRTSTLATASTSAQRDTGDSEPSPTPQIHLLATILVSPDALLGFMATKISRKLRLKGLAILRMGCLVLRRSSLTQFQACSFLSAQKLRFSTTETGIASFACPSVSLSTLLQALLLFFTVILKADSANPLAKMPLTLLTTSLDFAHSDAPTDLSDLMILQSAPTLVPQATEITQREFAWLPVPSVLELTAITSIQLASV